MAELVDLLTAETTRYYKMNKNGGAKKEHDELKTIIEEIQSEIDRRKKEKN